MQNAFEVVGQKGWGSVLVEAMLETAGLPYTTTLLDLGEPGPARDRLLALNPLGQAPTLVLPDGSVMTESAAIALYLAELRPQAGLAPPPGDADRPRFLRWLVFLVAAVYPTFTYGDDPARWVADEAARKQLRKATDAHRQALWRQLEGQIAAAPWFLGERFSALDIYVGAMTRWRPRRDWFAANCPKLHAIALQADAHPKLQEVWRRNFD